MSRAPALAALCLASVIGCKKPETMKTPPPGGEVTFSEVSIPAVADRFFSTCIVFEDLDGDHLPDIFLVPGDDGSGKLAAAVILHNTGGDFEVKAVPFHGVRMNGACAAGDIDNDGLTDIYISAVGDSVLLHNKGNLEFDDVTDSSGSKNDDPNAGGVSAAFLDYDHDGLLDLYTGLRPFLTAPTLGSMTPFECTATETDFQCHFPPGTDETGYRQANVLFHNVDGQNFVKTAGALGADNFGTPNSIGIVDYNHDGLPDIFIANDFFVNMLYLNQGGQSFRSIGPDIGMALYNHGMGVAFGDYDGNGTWDMFVSDMGPDQLWMGQAGMAIPAVKERAFELGVGEPTRRVSSWGALSGDFNQDGWVDIFSNSSGAGATDDDLLGIAENMNVDTTEPQHSVLFLNRGGASGFDAFPVSQRPYIPGPTIAASAAADFDGDGDLDLAVIYGRWPLVYFELLRNDTENAGHWLMVRLVGTHSNKTGQGAEVMIEAGGFKQLRMVHGQSGSGGKSSDVVHFGLGTATAVDKLTIRWPGGALQDVPGPIGAGQVLEVTEP